MNRRRGFTLIELMISMVIAMVVLGAAYNMLTNNQRFYRAQGQIVEVQQNVRAVTQILPSELHELDARGGDIISMNDTSMEIRAMRGFAQVCLAPNVAGGQIVLKTSAIFLPTGIDITRHNVFVFREGDSTIATDDKWLNASITATSTRNCSDGSAGTQLTLSIVGGNTQLDSVPNGAPVRIWEQVHYTLWEDASRLWWLATETMVSGSYSGLSAVAGPLRPSIGLWFKYYDATGAVTALRDSVRSMDVIARGLSTVPIMIQGKPTGQYADSSTVRVTLRNN